MVVVCMVGSLVCGWFKVGMAERWNAWFHIAHLADSWAGHFRDTLHIATTGNLEQPEWNSFRF